MEIVEYCPSGRGCVRPLASRQRRRSPPRLDADEIEALFDLPFNDLLFRAQTVHRQHFDPNHVQMSRLLSIKTGGCPEDCGYCPQSGPSRHRLEAGKLMAVEDVLAEAKRAKEAGARRFCMGAAWRNPKDRDLDACVRDGPGRASAGAGDMHDAGHADREQARRLKEAGLDYYNHNIDTSEEFYSEIITTRTYRDRLETLDHVREAGINVCCGGIVGMGEVARATAPACC